MALHNITKKLILTMSTFAMCKAVCSWLYLYLIITVYMLCVPVFLHSKQLYVCSEKKFCMIFLLSFLYHNVVGNAAACYMPSANVAHSQLALLWVHRTGRWWER